MLANDTSNIRISSDASTMNISHQDPCHDDDNDKYKYDDCTNFVNFRGETIYPSDAYTNDDGDILYPGDRDEDG